MSTAHYLLLYTFSPLLIGVACLYGWAGVCYTFLRFSRHETNQGLKDFLSRHQSYFAFRLTLPVPSQVRFSDISRAGHRGWSMLPLAYICMNASHVSWLSIIMANGGLFFGGLHFAYAWYGKRCLRLLGIDSFGDLMI